MIVLPDAENRTAPRVPSFLWTKHRNVTEGQTDGIILASTAVCIATRFKTYNGYTYWWLQTTDNNHLLMKAQSPANSFVGPGKH